MFPTTHDKNRLVDPPWPWYSRLQDDNSCHIGLSLAATGAQCKKNIEENAVYTLPRINMVQWYIAFIIDINSPEYILVL